MSISRICLFAGITAMTFFSAAAAPSDVDLATVRSATSSSTRNAAIRELMHRGKPPTLAERISNDGQATYHAQVLAGVDALGRVAIATDADEDGIADVYYLLTAAERLPGPWSRYIARAKVRYQDGSVSIESMDRDYALIGTGGGKQALRVRADRYSEVFELRDAQELSVSFGGAGTTNALRMDLISHNDVESWPFAFWLDYLEPGTGTVTCPDCSFCRNLPNGTTGVACLTEGQEQCNISPSTCSAFDSGCLISVCHTNSNQLDFACCSCAGPLSLCRCLQCEPPPCGVTGCGG